jgi:hypothetical protein
MLAALKAAVNDTAGSSGRGQSEEMGLFIRFDDVGLSSEPSAGPTGVPSTTRNQATTSFAVAADFKEPFPLEWRSCRGWNIISCSSHCGTSTTGGRRRATFWDIPYACTWTVTGHAIRLCWNKLSILNRSLDIEMVPNFMQSAVRTPQRDGGTMNSLQWCLDLICSVCPASDWKDARSGQCHVRG